MESMASALLTLGTLGRFGRDRFWTTVNYVRPRIASGDGLFVDSTPKTSNLLLKCIDLWAECQGSPLRI